MRTSQLNVGTSTDVSLKITETDLSLLSASIRAPSGNEEPCLLKRLPNRHIGTWGHGTRGHSGARRALGTEDMECGVVGLWCDLGLGGCGTGGDRAVGHRGRWTRGNG